MPSDQKPTVVLVHGAFADGSSWDVVIERLRAKGYAVQAPAIALRGVGVDAAYLSSVMKQIEGPVLLVGHSYGGALITNVDEPNVVGLVFVAAFAPDTDEALGEVTPESKDSILMSALVQCDYPTGTDGETAPELFIDPAKLREAFAADLPMERTSVMAATQRPVAPRPSGTDRGRRRGRACRHGPWWRPKTRPQEPISSDRFPFGRARRSPKWRVRTS
jgi:pimeloyl-ACP methyl ester carboxylesterase